MAQISGMKVWTGAFEITSLWSQEFEGFFKELSVRLVLPEVIWVCW